MIQNARNGIADRFVGYSYLDIDDSDVFQLADGVDDAAAAVPIPNDATGAYITIEHTSSAPVIRVSSNGSVPDIAASRGVAIYEDQSEIHVGSTAQHFARKEELDNFKVVIDTGKTARLHITYIDNRQ